MFSKAWVEPLAHVLKNLGSEACWICHGEGGMDEIVPTGTTWISELKDGKVTSFEITPEAAGLKRSSFEDLKGGDAAHNAEALRACAGGQALAFRDAAVMTAGAALVVAGKAEDLKPGVAAAQKAIDSGAAERRTVNTGEGLERLMATILDKIAAYKREEVAKAKAAIPRSELEVAAPDAPAGAQLRRGAAMPSSRRRPMGA